MKTGCYSYIMDESFGERLRRLRQERRMTQQDVADVVGKSRPWVTQLESETRWKGKLPPYDDLRLIARALKLPIGVIAGDQPPAVPLRPAWLDAAVDVLLATIGAAPLDRNEIALDQVVSATSRGKATGVHEESGRYRPKQSPLYVVKVEGDCMVPEVESGDSVRFDPELVPEDGDWVVATIDGERAVIKEYRIERGVQRLLPLNGEPLVIDENVRIVGVVLEVGKPSPRTRTRQRRVRPVSPRQRPLPGT